MQARLRSRDIVADACAAPTIQQYARLPALFLHGFPAEETVSTGYAVSPPPSLWLAGFMLVRRIAYVAGWQFAGFDHLHFP